MNSVNLVGRITREVEIRYAQNQTALCGFNVAVNRPFKNAQGQYDADFIPCVAIGKSAEFMGKYVRKGDLLSVTGRIQTRTYDDQNGQKRYVTEVVADNVEFLGSKASSENSNNTKGSSKNAEPTPYDFGDMPEPKGTDVDSNPFADFGSSIEISDDELPF